MKTLDEYHLAGYVVKGKVLDTFFTESVYAKQSDTEKEIIHNEVYRYAEGSPSCDCCKRLYANPDIDDEYNPCGDTISYQELFLVTPDDRKIDLLKEGYFTD